MQIELEIVYEELKVTNDGQGYNQINYKGKQPLQN